MKQREFDNAMVTLKAMVIAHKASKEPMSVQRVYNAARAAGEGRLRAADLAATFGRCAEQLVKVGLALRLTDGNRRTREYMPSTTGILVFHQHPGLFPKPGQQGREWPVTEAPARSQNGAERWKDALAVLGILASILSLIFASAGAKSIGGWLLTGSIALFIVYVSIGRDR